MVPCPNCQEPISVGPSNCGDSPQPVACRHCGHPWEPEIDAEDREEPGAGGRVHYDWAFRKAVEVGHLTPRQAYARGKREVYARQLAERHGLPPQIAYAVTDNRMLLAEALEQREFPPESRPAVSSSAGPWFRFGAAAGVFSLLALVGWQRPWNREPPAPPVRSIAASPIGSVATDASARVIHVVADDPADVLAAFCEGTPENRYEAIGLMPSTSGSTSTRIGVIRDRRHPDRPLAIAFRLDVSSGRWYAGNCLEPLIPSSAPAGPL